MLPGGLSVLGVFIITDSNANDILSHLQQVSNKNTFKIVSIIDESNKHRDWQIRRKRSKYVKWIPVC